MIKIVLISFVLISQVFAGTNMNKVLDTFKDKVKMVNMTNEGISLHFELHAAIYKVSKKNPNFEQIKKSLEKSKNENFDIEVVAEIPSMEIIKIE